MKPVLHFFFSALAVLALASLEHARAEETFIYLYTFGADASTDGHPTGNPIQAADGNFYGTTNRTIFRLTPAGKVTTSHSFDSGTQLRPPLVQTGDGSFYGVSDEGDGTVFRLAPDGTLTTLHAFVGTDGSDPSTGLLLGKDGNLYGGTDNGGANNAGTLFRITPDGTFTLLYSFNGTDRQAPFGPMVRADDGSLYGASSDGGTDYNGLVFRLATDGTLTTLHTFNGPDGRVPDGGLIQDADGNLYGTTIAGGSGDDGTVFRLTPGGTLTTLHSFSGADGDEPIDLIPAGNGEFYGTAFAGGPSLGNFGDSRGRVYKLGVDGTFIPLHDFDGFDGGDPEGLVHGSDGTLFGITTNEDPDGSPDPPAGSVFKLVTDQVPVLPVVTTAVASDSPLGYPDGEVDVLMSISSTLTEPLKVRYTVEGSAVAGQDYQALSGVVKFKKLQNIQLIRVLATAAGQNSGTSPVVKIKLLPGSDYTLGGPRTLKIHLPSGD